jgi:alpha-ketoglutarate-dependent taurine dioxygenase
VLIIDNVAVMHGRISFSGERKILSFLTKNWEIPGRYW